MASGVEVAVFTSPAAESFMSLVTEMEMVDLCSWLSSNVSMETLLSLMPTDQIPPDMLQLLSHATLSASVSSPSTIQVTLQLNPKVVKEDA